MVGSDGGIFSFGDARFHGSMGGMPLNGPVVGLAPTDTHGGYRLVGDDGGIFAFGDAAFHGSMGGVPLNQPVTAIILRGDGYMMVASDGAVFDFGSSDFLGSPVGRTTSAVVAATVRADRSGYLVAERSGRVHAFGSSVVIEADEPAAASRSSSPKTAWERCASP